MSTKCFSAKVPKAGIYLLDTIFDLSAHKGLVTAPIYLSKLKNYVQFFLIMLKYSYKYYSSFCQNYQNMSIVNTQDSCVIVTILGNKTNTYLVKNSYMLLTKFHLKHNFKIQVAPA